jgi:hypothetical protein
MTREKQQQRVLPTGPLAILAAALLWSMAGLLIKYLDWPPLAIASARSLLASWSSVFFSAGAFGSAERVTWLSGWP